MKVLVIHGSPRRKGNTATVVKLVEEELNKLGKVTVEHLNLADTTLHLCIGCHNCLFKGEEKCSLTDDRDTILGKMKQADGVIFTSPTYVLTVSALFKNFMDRFAFICHRPVFFDKHAMLITSTGAMAEKKTLKAMELVITAWGFHVAAQLGLRIPPMMTKEEIWEKNQKQIRRQTHRFYHHLAKDKPASPSFGSIMQFLVFKKISFAYPDVLKADYAFYKELEHVDFYPGIRINPLKKGIARLLTKIITPFLF